MNDLKAIAADYVFDGERVHRNQTVMIEAGSIFTVLPTRELMEAEEFDLPIGLPVHKLPRGAWLAPGFIDVQVNGGGDVLFNDTPTADAIDTIAAAHRRFGTTALLPTLITDSDDKMRAAAQAVRVAMARNPSVLGIHFEGPFLSAGKPGIHDRTRIRRPDPDDMVFLTGLPDGVTLVTLAPEEAPDGFIRQLTGAGVRVSLGHSMATYEQTRAALAEGLSGFTHLFNAMRPLDSREPGPIAAALETPDACYGIIVDGVHVAPAMLRLALRGAASPMLVTDAMPPVGGSRDSFTLNGRTITVRDGRCAAADGTLAGAALDMASAVRNCVAMLGVPLVDALRFASAVPADFLRVGNRLGRLAPGYRADLVAFMPDQVDVLATWVAGERMGGLHEGRETA
jgi:N-acetylglucosamine-6-phosphate deacetylase